MHLCAQMLGNQPKKPTMIAQRNKIIGRVIEIVGITVGDRGCSCEEHVAYCGVVLAPNGED
jgi:hypothetical protein